MAGRDSSCPALRTEKGFWLLLHIIPFDACSQWTGLQCSYLSISTLQISIRYCNVFSFSLHAVLGMLTTENIDFSECFFPVQWCYSRLARALFDTTIDGSTWRKWRKPSEHLDLLFSHCSGAGEGYASGHGMVLPWGQESWGKYVEGAALGSFWEETASPYKVFIHHWDFFKVCFPHVRSCTTGLKSHFFS